MDNRTIIISGSGALATAFFNKLSGLGWQVAILALHEPKNFNGFFFKCDFTQDKEIETAVLKVKEQLGTITAAVHTAVSPICRKRALDISYKEFVGAFLVDVFGGFVFAQAVGRIMKEQGFGRIIALSSEAVEDKSAPAGMAGYVSAKFAVKGWLKVMSQELGNFNVAVSALAPGFMDTPLNRDLPSRLLEFIAERQGGKLVTPEEVADVLGKVLTLQHKDCSKKTFFVRPGGGFIPGQDF